MSDGTLADSVFFTTSPIDIDSIDPGALEPARLGAVMLTIPQQEGDVLMIADISAKSDWYDREARVTRENPEVLALFRRLNAHVKKYLKGPVWAGNVRGGPLRRYPQIGYTSGVTEWVTGGGELAQPGVANVRFFLDDPHARFAAQT